MNSLSNLRDTFHQKVTHPITLALFGGVSLILIKQFYLLEHLGYPAGPSEVQTQHCSYATSCPVDIGPTMGIVIVFAVVAAVLYVVGER